VQRIEAAKTRQKRIAMEKARAGGATSRDVELAAEALRIPVDSLRVACQDACPAGAIRFGNLLDDKSKGARFDSQMVLAKRLERNYDLLHYIGTRPRTSYLARVKNPNPDMPDAPYIGKATIHMV
jgi:molybdopterin-containing oxidoreductase family iron-sulfur binding subunit